VDALDIKLEDTDKLNSTDDKHLRQVRTILTEVIYPIISGMVVKSLFSIICKVYLFQIVGPILRLDNAVQFHWRPIRV